MREETNLPPARERNRYGIRPFAEIPPVAAEALLDRVELRVQGVIQTTTEEALDRFIERIATSANQPALFGRPQRRRGSWVAKVISGSTISTGKLTVSRVLPDAQFDITLVVNPTRTLAHLLDQYPVARLAELTPFEFFAPAEEPSARGLTLDRSDNMVSDVLAFAGSWHAIYLQRVAQFLSLFETALRRRLIYELCPPEDGYEHLDDEQVSSGWNDLVNVRIDWGSLTVSQCEVCWERYDAEALAKVHAMADGILASARSAMVRTHPDADGPTVERNLGAMTIRVPLTPSGHIVLAIYAKAQDRLRFEIRYLKNLPDLVRPVLPRTRTLTHWFDAIRQEASDRIPWSQVCRMLRAPERPNVEVLAELLASIADATDKAKTKRQGIFRELLCHGAITATTADGPTPATVLEQLQRRGVVEHVRLIGRDSRIGRRYRLAERFQSVLDLHSPGT